MDLRPYGVDMQIVIVKLGIVPSGMGCQETGIKYNAFRIHHSRSHRISPMILHLYFLLR